MRQLIQVFVYVLTHSTDQYWLNEVALHPWWRYAQHVFDLSTRGEQNPYTLVWRPRNITQVTCATVCDCVMLLGCRFESSKLRSGSVTHVSRVECGHMSAIWFPHMFRLIDWSNVKIGRIQAESHDHRCSLLAIPSQGNWFVSPTCQLALYERWNDVTVCTCFHVQIHVLGYLSRAPINSPDWLHLYERAAYLKFWGHEEMYLRFVDQSPNESGWTLKRCVD